MYVPIEIIKAYFNKVAVDDQVYQRFMDCMRLLRAPILATSPNQDYVAILMKSLEKGQDWHYVSSYFCQVLYQAQLIDTTIPMLQRRSFKL